DRVVEASADPLHYVAQFPIPHTVVVIGQSFRGQLRRRYLSCQSALAFSTTVRWLIQKQPYRCRKQNAPH
ncbi:hypothetical protein, partial [Xenorhabdus bovienii]|uniref:hypothetical protein n=1 Tax=Xenorhabdus bovienii TaxID=40576 RepID=UPI0023B2BD99